MDLRICSYVSSGSARTIGARVGYGNVWNVTTHHQTIAEEFNNYYVSVADNITNNNLVNNAVGDLNKNNPLSYLYSASTIFYKYETKKYNYWWNRKNY